MIKINNRRGDFLGLIGLLLLVGVVIFLAQYFLKSSYLKPKLDKESQEAAAEAGINTANYQTVVQSTRDTVQGIVNQRQRDNDALGLH